MTYNRDQFMHRLLTELGVPVNDNNLSALHAWAECEGSDAQFNPLDTTQPEKGAEPYNTFGNDQHVWNYPDEETGIRATVTTLRNGHYPNILRALEEGSGLIVHGAARDDMHTWGTNADCIASKLGHLHEPTNTTSPHPLTQTHRDMVHRVVRFLNDRDHRLTDGDRELITELRAAARHADGVQ